MDRVDATPSRLHRELEWRAEAKKRLDELVEAAPLVARISAAKRLRDAAEQEARRAGETQVNLSRLERAKELAN
jgi:chlorophyllide a reductase subunit Z